MTTPSKEIIVKVNESDETLETVYGHYAYPAGVVMDDVEAYWSDKDIRHAIAEMNGVDIGMVTVDRNLSGWPQ